MWNAAKIKELCAVHKVRPSKARGQHFLLDEQVAARMVRAAAVSPKETVVEVGAGWGILTEKLLNAGARVIAIEIEKTMAAYLHEAHPSAVIIAGDVRRFWEQAPQEPYMVVANIHYSITGAVIRGFLEKTPQAPQKMIIMVQKEVAQRLTAAPPDMSLLSLSAQWYGEPKLLFCVPRGAFWPPPEVDSAVVIIDRIRRPDKKITDHVFALARRAFKTKRKMLSGSLIGGTPGKTKQDAAETLEACGIPGTARPQELSAAQWRALSGVCCRMRF